MMVLALVLKVLTALALMVMILAQYSFSLMDSEVICNFRKISLTDSVNKPGLRDASASKNTLRQSSFLSDQVGVVMVQF